MARPLEEHRHYVSESDRETPIHSTVAAARGLIEISEADARRLSAAKRARSQPLAIELPPNGEPLTLDDIPGFVDLLRRVHALEQRPAGVSSESQPDLTPIFDAIENLAGRIAALENAPRTVTTGEPVAVDVSDLEEKIRQLAKHMLGQEEALQLALQNIDTLKNEIEKILNAPIPVIEKKAG